MNGWRGHGLASPRAGGRVGKEVREIEHEEGLGGRARGRMELKGESEYKTTKHRFDDQGMEGCRRLVQGKMRGEEQGRGSRASIDASKMWSARAGRVSKHRISSTRAGVLIPRFV